ncbi:acyltransferase family protein [Alteromonas sp. M12]|uniref:acyltransferase family protein n=1 Tax=Alteromonas sp. M12 TaxID=3135644 RepID=UPI00319E140B
MSTPSKYQPHIDGLRAIAVMSVLLFHLDIETFSGGFVGVDIFFVISGFLITRIIVTELEKTGQFSFKNFYTRRIRRLLPAFLVMLFVTFFLASVLFSPDLFKSFGASVVASLLSVSNILFWLEADYFDVSSHLKPLLHTWSLSIEEQFYMFWPITLLLLFKWGLKKWIPFLISILFILSLALNQIFYDGQVYFLTQLFPSTETLIQDGRTTIFYLLPFRVFEFTCGAILVFLPSFERVNKIIANALSLLGLVLIGYPIFSFDAQTVFPSLNALYPCIGTALLIIAGANSRIAVLLENSWVTWFGLISYSLYLVHWPLIVFFKYFKINLPLTQGDQFAITITSILLAYASYRWVETPFRHTTYTPAVARKPMAVLGSVAIIVAFSLSAYLQSGWSWRVNSQQNLNFTISGEGFHLENYGGKGFPRSGPLTEDFNPEILLIGDSHGRHFLFGLNKQIYSKHGINILVNAGTSCLHLPGFTKLNADQNYDISCPKAYQRIKHFLETNTDIKLVIIGQRWADQFSRAGLIDSGGQKVKDKVDKNDLFQGLVGLKSLLKDIPLLVIGQLPETNNTNLHDFMTRPFLDELYEKQKIKLRNSALPKYHEAVNSMLLEFTEMNKNVYFLNPSDVLCNNGLCANYNAKNELIYSDTHHLSKAGSFLVISKFEAEILKIMKGNSDRTFGSSNSESN